MGEFCFVQRLIKLPTPDVQVVGKGGSVEPDGTGIFYTHYTYYYTLYPLSVFSYAKSLQQILEIRSTYRLVSYLLTDN